MVAEKPNIFQLADIFLFLFFFSFSRLSRFLEFYFFSVRLLKTIVSYRTMAPELSSLSLSYIYMISFFIAPSPLARKKLTNHSLPLIEARFSSTYKARSNFRWGSVGPALLGLTGCYPLHTSSTMPPLSLGNNLLYPDVCATLTYTCTSRLYYSRKAADANTSWRCLQQNVGKFSPKRLLGAG